MLHLARQEDWERAQAAGEYSAAGGIVYGCSEDQLPIVVDAHFPDLTGWLVLSVDESMAQGEVRLVTFSEGGRSETFPHLHGCFPVAAVSEVRSLAQVMEGAEE